MTTWSSDSAVSEWSRAQASSNPFDEYCHRGHNGLKSISQELGGYKDFLRIGIGIGRPEDRDPNVVARYVLGNFEREEE